MPNLGLMKDNYRWMAPVYSSLSHWVFGRQLEEAKTCFLSNIPNKTILILGGGDGKDYSRCRQSLQGDFVEKSASMLQLAKRNLQGAALNFILGEPAPAKKYDAILLPFVLDTFSDQELDAFFEGLGGKLKAGGKVYLSDFHQTDSAWQKAGMTFIIGVFRLVTGHVRKDLPDYSSYFDRAGFKLVLEKSWQRGWIKAQMWEQIT